MKKTFQRGFTLIELLVVIAIIGILAAVVIGSLNDARSGGQDASIKQSVANIRSQAELVYNRGNYTYEGVCDDAQVGSLLIAATNVVNGTAYASSTQNTSVASNDLTGAANTRNAGCNDGPTTYVAVAPLASVDAFWCVDSTGASKQVTSDLVSTDTACPTP